MITPLRIDFIPSNFLSGKWIGVVESSPSRNSFCIYHIQYNDEFTTVQFTY